MLDVLVEVYPIDEKGLCYKNTIKLKYVSFLDSNSDKKEVILEHDILGKSINTKVNIVNNELRIYILPIRGKIEIDRYNFKLLKDLAILEEQTYLQVEFLELTME